MYRILIIGGSGSGKTNALNLISHQPDINKTYDDSKAFIEGSNDIDDIYKNIEEHNPNKERKKLIYVLKNLIQ